MGGGAIHFTVKAEVLIALRFRYFKSVLIVASFVFCLVDRCTLRARVSPDKGRALSGLKSSSCPVFFVCFFLFYFSSLDVFSVAS